MATSMLLKFLTLKWDISRTIWRIEVSDGSFFCIFHALSNSFELNFFFDRSFPLTLLMPLKRESRNQSSVKGLGKLNSLCNNPITYIYIYRFYLSPHSPPTFEVVRTIFGSLISPCVPLGHQSGSALWLQLCNIWAS